MAVPAVAASTWAGTRVLTDAPKRRRIDFRIRARFPDPDAPPDRVVLEGDGADVGGRWGLVLADSYARVLDPIDWQHDGDTVRVVRPYVHLDGELPLASRQDERRTHDRREPDRDEHAATAKSAPVGRRLPGRDRRRHEHERPWPVPAALHPYAWPPDPQVLARETHAQFWIDALPIAHGRYLPAWRFTPFAEAPEDIRDTWVIGVHGRGSARSELFRICQVAIAGGATCLVVSYRTDEWTANPERVTRLGETEWEDVERAVEMAVDEGARRIVLAGCSLGGAIVATLLRRSPLADRISGVILDSPALAWGPILQHVASVNRVPKPLVPMVMAAAKVRSRIDWETLDHIAGAGEFVHPILLIHGVEDDVVPVWLSDAFAAARPDLITYVRIEGADHVSAWNHDAVRYEREVRRFLTDVTEAPAPRALPASEHRRRQRAHP